MVVSLIIDDIRWYKIVIVKFRLFTYDAGEGRFESYFDEYQQWTFPKHMIKISMLIRWHHVHKAFLRSIQHMKEKNNLSCIRIRNGYLKNCIGIIPISRARSNGYCLTQYIQIFNVEMKYTAKSCLQIRFNKICRLVLSLMSVTHNSYLWIPLTTCYSFALKYCNFDSIIIFGVHHSIIWAIELMRVPFTHIIHTLLCSN